MAVVSDRSCGLRAVVGTAVEAAAAAAAVEGVAAGSAVILLCVRVRSGTLERMASAREVSAGSTDRGAGVAAAVAGAAVLAPALAGVALTVVGKCGWPKCTAAAWRNVPVAGVGSGTGREVVGLSDATACNRCADRLLREGWMRGSSVSEEIAADASLARSASSCAAASARDGAPTGCTVAWGAAAPVAGGWLAAGAAGNGGGGSSCCWSSVNTEGKSSWEG